jgi:hypothetical protein
MSNIVMEDRQTLTWIHASHRVRLLDKIDLEADKVSDLIRIPLDRDHGQEIHEWLTTFPIIDQTQLRFRSLIDLILQIKD